MQGEQPTGWGFRSHMKTISLHAAVLFLVTATVASAAERVRMFESDLTVKADAYARAAGLDPLVASAMPELRLWERGYMDGGVTGIEITKHRVRCFETVAEYGDDRVLTIDPAKMARERSVVRVPSALNALPRLAVFDKATISCGVMDGESVLVDFVEGMHRVVFEVDNPGDCHDKASKAIAPILRWCANPSYAELFDVQRWSDLHRWFRAFPTDADRVAESLAVCVAGLLADEWDSLRRLEREIRKDPDFESFVLSHIHATSDDGDLPGIIKNVTTKCPEKLTPLCAAISAAAQKALDEAKALDPATLKKPRPD